MNAGYIRKAPEPEHEGRGRKSDGSWEVRRELLNQPKSEPASVPEHEPTGWNLTPTIEPGIPTEPLVFEVQPNWANTELPF